MQVDDADLVNRLRAGDDDAFADLVRHWSPPMTGVARLYVQTQASAQDVVQETWLAVISGLDGFEGRSTLRTWVFRILVNVARRRGRVDARIDIGLDEAAVDPRRFRGDTDEYPGHWAAGAEPADSGPEGSVLGTELRRLLAAALRQLPARQRTVVELRDVHGLDAREVSELLELSAANQRVLLHRGRSRLRSLLEEARR